MMNLFKRNNKCEHIWDIKRASNVLQLDYNGYPVRLFICECQNCGKNKQLWLDVPLEQLKELNTGESALLEWKDV